MPRFDQVPETERLALVEVMAQAEMDMQTAHEAICKLQGLDPRQHRWPAWSPQANTSEWFGAIRAKFKLVK